MKQVAISIQNLSKKYKIGEKQDYLTLRDQLSKMSRSFLQFGKTKKQNTDFWALTDVSLDIEKGDVVGIVGKNGAGKSTLLKIISRITPPTKGKIELHGRVASLLEVGTGFSPELTGRENIFLNGSILGMSRKEIKAKFNDIVEFSEIGEFLDTQVKYYSSGMYVRLAFAVAAHLDPDILIVDEVLAVGDAEFQKKCLNKISSISESEGRTVLFVSHNMSSVVRLCNKAVLLENGKVKDIGKPSVIVEKYLRESKKNKAQHVFKNFDDSMPAQLLSASVLNNDGKLRRTIILEEGFQLRIDYKINKEVQAGAIVITVKHQDDVVFISTDCDSEGKLKRYKKGTYSCFVDFPEHLLNSGQYTLTLAISKPGINFYSKKQDVMIEVVSNNSFRNAIFNDQVPGVVSPLLKFTNQEYIK